MSEKLRLDCTYPELSVSIDRVYMKDGKEMFHLVVLHLKDNPFVDLLFQTYNGAVVGLFRLLSNNMAAV